jgi:hypothetical protein
MARQHGKHQAEHFARLASALGLTEQQKAAARKLHDETSAREAPLHERARLQHEEIQAMLESGTAEPSDLGERMIELHATHRKLQALHEQMKTRLGAKLSAEQRAKLDKLHEEHAGPAGMHGLCKR